MAKKIIHTSGTRKTARARATLHEGNGRVKVNNIDLNVFTPELARMKIMEPLLLAPEVAQKVNIDVNIHGGGSISGADAARLAVSKALVAYSGKAVLKQQFLDYDRTLLVADVRVKEVCKPNDSKARAKRQKSYR
jgi:small subunit ribosomal protein S9